MLGKSPSKRFQHLLNNESVVVQREIMRTTLLPLLDSVKRSEAEKTLLKARRVAIRYRGVPKIDLGIKKVEVNNLMDDLTRVAKNNPQNRHDQIDSILYEVLESVTSWLNDIWTTAYEFGVDFLKVHSCLVFSIGVLDHIQSFSGICKCILGVADIPIIIKDRHGHIVKEFTNVGVKSIEDAIFWVWKEVLLSLLASKDKTAIKMTPDLLTDIDDLVGWEGLERLVLGGRTFVEYSEDRILRNTGTCSACGTRRGEGNLDGSESDDEDECFYSEHWSFKILKRAPKLRRLVFDRMHAIFRASPSTKLFNCLVSVSPNENALQAIDATLLEVAEVSATALATALEVYADDNKAEDIARLLNSSCYLLLPRDAHSFQQAVVALSLHRLYSDLALEHTERELMSSIRTIHRLVQPLFSRMDAPAQQDAIAQIIKTRHGSPARQELVERWVDTAVTTGMQGNNPMALAAMLMGLPVPDLQPPDELDQLSLLDLNLDDPDLDEPKEQLRPDVRSRLKSWVETAEGIEGGHTMLNRVHKEVVDIMPCLEAEDLVEEMIGRIAEWPSRHHICEALEYASRFVRDRKKYIRRQARTAFSVNQDSTAPDQVQPRLNSILEDVD